MGHVEHGLSQVTVLRAQKIERKTELKEQPINQYEVSNRHGTGSHTLSPHKGQASESHTKDGTLTKIEKGQAGGDLDGSTLQFQKNVFIAVRFLYLTRKRLDRLQVQQTICGLQKI